MNIYKFKTGSGKVAELMKDFNKTDFGRLVNLFTIMPTMFGCVLVMLSIVYSILDSNFLANSFSLDNWIYLFLLITVFLACIARLLYFFFLNDYVKSLKDEK